MLFWLALWQLDTRVIQEEETTTEKIQLRKTRLACRQTHETLS